MCQGIHGLYNSLENLEAALKKRDSVIDRWLTKLLNDEEVAPAHEKAAYQAMEEQNKFMDKCKEINAKLDVLEAQCKIKCTGGRAV